MRASIPALMLILFSSLLTAGCATSPTTKAVTQNDPTPIPPSQTGEGKSSVSISREVTPIKLVEFQESEDADTTLIGPASEILPPPADVIRWNTEESADIAAESYDLPMLLGLASSNNPTLQQANLHISANLAQAQQAGLYPNPMLAYLGENIGVEGPESSKERNSNRGLSRRTNWN